MPQSQPIGLLGLSVDLYPDDLSRKMRVVSVSITLGSGNPRPRRTHKLPDKRNSDEEDERVRYPSIATP